MADLKMQHELSDYIQCLVHIAKMACWNDVLQQPKKTLDEEGHCKCFSCSAKKVLRKWGRSW